MKKVINVACDFSKYPGGRYVTDGKHSGQGFRERLLVPALKENDAVEIQLDGTLGYGSSFLEEAFGGLIRIEGFSMKQLDDALQLKSGNEVIIATIRSYIAEAAKEAANSVTSIELSA